MNYKELNEFFDESNERDERIYVKFFEKFSQLKYYY